jgi:hypothetical protein
MNYLKNRIYKLNLRDNHSSEHNLNNNELAEKHDKSTHSIRNP